jgi:hypothetical protein
MRKALASAPLVLLLVLPPSLAAAGGVELSGFTGYTFPFYSQTFSYGPGPISVPIEGVSITQNGAFELKTSGGLSLGGSLTLYPAETFGIELRLDSASVDLQPQNAVFDVKVTLPAPASPVQETITLEDGTGEISAPHPFSINLKLRSSGRTKLFASGGVSRMGDLNLAISQTVAIGVTVVNLQTSNLEIGTIGLRATGTPGHHWGGNLGLGLQLPLGEHGGLVLEGRGFYFPKQTIEWEPVIDTPLGPLESELLNRVLNSLAPVEFKPWWVQATIGVSYRF